MMSVAKTTIEQDVFGDNIEGEVWTFPNQWGGEDKVVKRNLVLYLQQYLGAKKAIVLKREQGTFFDSDAWTFPDDGYTVEVDDLELYLQWAYGASKEYV
jgi:hypothetical protein